MRIGHMGCGVKRSINSSWWRIRTSRYEVRLSNVRNNESNSCKYFGEAYLEDMAQAGVKREDIVGAPDCDRCGAKSRLFGIELHPDVDRSELRTYVCEQCDALQTEVVPLR